MGGARRRRVDPTDTWEQLALLCKWPEQLAYEEIRPLALFGSSVPERAEETGSSARTLCTVALAQRRLFALGSLGEGGWLKALRLEDYAPRRL